MSRNNQTIDRIQAIWNMCGGDDGVDLLMAGKVKLKFEIVSSGSGTPDKILQQILNQKVVTISQAERAFRWHYSTAQVEELLQTCPSDELWDLARQGYRLFPGPVCDLTLVDIENMAADVLFPNARQSQTRHSSGCERDRAFASTDVVRKVSWMKIRQRYDARWVNKNWEEQVKLLQVDKGEYVPNAAEVAYCYVLYHRIYGSVDDLHPDYIRTSSVSSGNHVIHQSLTARAMTYNLSCDIPDSRRVNNIGLAVARR